MPDPARRSRRLTRGACLVAPLAWALALVATPSVDAARADRLIEAAGGQRGERAAGFGYAVTGVGDWDGDGVADFAASAPALGEVLPGGVWVLSGATGEDLVRFIGDPGDDFGYALAGGIDVNGDGTGDLLVGVRAAAGGGIRRGEVRAYSGRSRKRLDRTLQGTGDHDLFGSALAAIDDVDGDGVRDLVVGAPGADDGAGAARIYSARSFALVHTVRGKHPGARLGSAVADAGDVDGDGRGDLLVGSPNETGAATNSGVVRVITGRTWRTLRTLWGALAHERFGTRVATLGDVDGDGRSEFAVASPSAELDGLADAGRVRVFDGADGSLRFEVRGAVAGAFLGRGLAGDLDLDGDGHPDLIVGSPYALGHIGRKEHRVGSIQAFSGVDGAPLEQWHGGQPGELLGWSVAILRDPGGTGPAVGLVAGAPGRRDTPPQAGDPPTQQGRVRHYATRGE